MLIMDLQYLAITSQSINCGTFGIFATIDSCEADFYCVRHSCSLVARAYTKVVSVQALYGRPR